MTIQEVHEIVYDKLNKDQTGYITHGQIDRALDVAQLYYMKELYGPPEQYQPGRPVSRTATTQKWHDDLMPFKRSIPYNPFDYSAVNTYGTGPDGLLVLPSDYLHFGALTKHTSSFAALETLSLAQSEAGNQATTFEYNKLHRIVISFVDATDNYFSLTYEGDTLVTASTYQVDTLTVYYTPSVPNGTLSYVSQFGGVETGEVTITVTTYEGKTNPWPIEMLGEDQLAYRNGSSLLAPSSTEPVALLYTASGYVNGVNIGTNRVIKFFPESPLAGDLMYFKRPAVPVFSFSQSGRTITYDPSTSTQLEWGDQAIMKIIDKAVNYLAIHLQDQLQLQHTQMKDTNGI